MKPNQTDVVGEYLYEVELRLSGLPLLQRRELLADLAAHIESERADRNVRSESELIEVLERLGSPEVVAAAAYEEAGASSAPTVTPPTVTPPPVAPPQFVPPRFAPMPAAPRRTPWVFVILAIVGVVIVLCLGGALAMNRGADAGEAPQPVEPARASLQPS
jgi:hypothetical protein